MPVALYGQADTLWTANVLGGAYSSEEVKTSSDSLLATISSASSYLSKDSRFILKQYTPGSVVTSSFGGASSEQSRVLWDGIDISSMASGVFDLSLVPASMLNKILTGIRDLRVENLEIYNFEIFIFINFFSMILNSLRGNHAVYAMLREHYIEIGIYEFNYLGTGIFIVERISRLKSLRKIIILYFSQSID